MEIFAGDSNLTQKGDYYERKKRNIEKNVMTMLQLIFPTKFPVINDLHKSFDYIYRNNSYKPLLVNPIATKYFSYLKMDNQIYTFKKVVWINDLLNHPKYKELLLEYHKFRVWVYEQNINNTNAVNKAIEETIKSIDDSINSGKGDIPKLENLKKLIIENNHDGILDLLGRKNDISDITKILKAAITKKNITNNYLTKKYEYKQGLSTQYRRFADYIMRQYKEPVRTSSNTVLQNIIKSETDESVQDFYNYFEKIYNVFFLNSGEKIEQTDEGMIKRLLDVGICDINTNLAKGHYKEIYIMADFIEGEVNDGNVNNVFCPYIGEKLGNDLETMIKDSQRRNVDNDYWKIDKDRMFFSLKNMLVHIYCCQLHRKISISPST
jgi:hypothetical protein